MSTGTQVQPFEKRWTTDDDNILGDPPAQRRKPRMYASFNFASDACAYPLDFCLWLHRNFTEIAAAINEGRLESLIVW